MTKLETRIAAADTFIDAEQFDSARGLIDGAMDELDLVLGRDEKKEGEPEAAAAAEKTADNEVASP